MNSKDETSFFLFLVWETTAHKNGRLKYLLKVAGLNECLNPHSLPHTHTSLLAEAGVGLDVIMRRLCHKDDDTTQYVHMHVTKSMKKESSRKFSELMRGLRKNSL